MNSQGEQQFVILVIAVMVALYYYRRKWRGSKTAHGTAIWASDQILRTAGMLSDCGLILGRTLSGMLIRLPTYCHGILIGGTGSGKGVSCIFPQLLTYVRGSVVCFDVKGDLWKIAGPRRAKMGERIIRLAPFSGGTDALNPLDAIPADSPMLVDHARGICEALVVRGSEPDPHWNEKAVQVLCAIMVLVLLRFEGEDRSLNSVQEIASDEKLLAAAADKLREIGGIPARLGNQLKTLFAQEEN